MIINKKIRLTESMTISLSKEISGSFGIRTTASYIPSNIHCSPNCRKSASAVALDTKLRGWFEVWLVIPSHVKTLK